MILDFGVFFSKKTSVCLMDGCVLLSLRSNFKLVRIEIVNEGEHLSFHLDSEKKRRRSYLERIAENPLLILRERGDAGVNLGLYVSFVTKGAYRPKVDGTERQEIIKDIIYGNKEVWSRIMKTDVSAYDKLSSVLGIDVDTDSRDILMKKELNRIFSKLHDDKEQGIDERETVCEILKNKWYVSEEVGFILRIHHDFCTTVNRTSIRENMDIEYNKMLDSIFHDTLNEGTQICSIFHPFYNEIELYNSFVQCKGNLLLFDRDTLNRNVFHSVTERGIRDFVSNKVLEFYMSENYHGLS